MPQLRTEAIVLRTFEYSETSQVVWFFTKHHGRLHALAKGARRARSEFEGALEPFVGVTIEVYRKDGRELDILGDLELLDLRLSLRDSLSRLTWATFIIELLVLTIQPDDPNPEFFDFTVASLDNLAHHALPDLPAVALLFEAQLLQSIGLFPNLARCLTCTAPIVEPRPAYDAIQGGALCPEHGSGRPTYSLGSLRSFQSLVDSVNPERIVFSRATLRELRKLLNDTWRAQLATDLKTAPSLWDELAN